MTSPGQPVSGLIERIEAAGGPDRELDCRIWCLVGVGSQYDETNCWLAATVRPPELPALGLTLSEWIDKYPEDAAAHAKSYNVPAYTASIDAAMTLVPTARRLTVQQRRSYEPFWVNLMRDDGTDYDATGRAASFALALCAAALKAKAMEARQGRDGEAGSVHDSAVPQGFAETQTGTQHDQ